MGAGYVPALFASFAPLRRRLFAPFREVLLGEAVSVGLADGSYFDGLDAFDPAAWKVVPLAKAITMLRGQVVLQGESGFGKTLFAHRLARRSRQVTVVLSASRMEKGTLLVFDRLAWPAWTTEGEGQAQA